MKELHTNHLGGKMRKFFLMIIFYLLIYSNIFSIINSNPITIYYGIGPISYEDFYNLKEETTNKLILTEDKLEVFDISSDKLLRKINMTKEEYSEIISVINTIIEKEKKIQCSDIYNFEKFYLKITNNTIREINLVIDINNKETCTQGKNELLEYLNNKYNIEMKWEKGPSELQEILKSEEIVLYYGVRSLPDKDSYDLKEVTTNKLIITNKKIQLFQVNFFMKDIKLIKEVKIDRKEYLKIGDLIFSTINKTDGTQCKNIFNVNNGISRDVSIRVIKPINLVIGIQEDEYCSFGKNELLEYLNNEYQLNMKWIVEVRE